jgi:hypothetical protein
MISRIHLLTVLLVAGLVGSTSVFAQEAETEEPAADSAVQQETPDSLEPPPGEEGRKRFWLTDPAMIEKVFSPSAYKRTFPLMKDLAGDKALPRPLGIAVNAYWQKQDYDVTSAVIEVGGLPPFEIDTSGIDAIRQADAPRCHHPQRLPAIDALGATCLALFRQPGSAVA